MGELRNQLKSQNLSTVSPTAFGEVGGRVFPDNPSIADVNDLIQIVRGGRPVILLSLVSPIAKRQPLPIKPAMGKYFNPPNPKVWRSQPFVFPTIVWVHRFLLLN